MNLQRVSILGVNISAINMNLALSQIHEWIAYKKQAYICVAPAHSIMECVNDPALLPVFNEADMVTPDGMSIVWLLQLKGYKETRRVYGPDLLLAACQFGIEKNWKHFFYGGETDVAKDLSESFKNRIPGIHIAGYYSPPFGRPSEIEEQKLLEILNQSEADIVWIGMSSPWQETWMHEYRSKINVPILVGVGAAFDFLSGAKKQAPRWIQRVGMEWLYRLTNEPKRLWPRYRQYPKFAWLAIKELVSKNTSKIDK